MKLPSGVTPASRLREVRADGDVVAAAEKLEQVRTPGSGSEVASAAVLTGLASAMCDQASCGLQLAGALRCSDWLCSTVHAL